MTDGEKGTRKYKQWTMQEINYLREAYPIVPNRVLARALSVTPQQVRAAAQRHGFTKVRKLRLPVEYLGLMEKIPS